MAKESNKEYANKLLPHLVLAVKTLKTITYGELESKTGMHRHTIIPRALGYIRDEIVIPRHLPYITAIVIKKDTKLPGDKWLPEGTSHLSPDENKQKFEEFRDQVFAFTGWYDLLKELGLSPIKPTDENLDDRGRAYSQFIKRTGGGEGEDHRQLKEFVATHPELIGLRVKKPPIIEYPFVSGDEGDVVFELSKNQWAVAEIKNGELGELVKGIYQAIKYRALLQAEKGHGSPVQVDAVLVAYQIPSEISLFAAKFGIRCKIINRKQVDSRS